tara:strand:+ start:155 stop:751 length:597 start_codon:yes stop_codon:yes gene_type:complete
MPQRSQLNVLLDASLLTKVKRDARKKGYTISEYISELIAKEPNEVDQDELKLLTNRVSNLEDDIYNVKKDCPGQSKKKMIRPFTKEESKNCTNFMRLIFKKVIKQKKLKSQIAGWNDFLPHIEKFDSWTSLLTLRLKEVMLFEEPEPWTSDELNRLTKEKNCPCPIREALISWSNVKDFPDQQTICDHGEELVKSFWS